MYQIKFRKISCKRFICFSIYVLLLLPGQPGYAQIPLFSWSDPFKAKGDSRFAGSKDSSLYVLQSKGNKEVVVRQFSPGLRLNDERMMSFGTSDHPAQFLLSFVSDTGLVHFQYLFDNKKDSVILSMGSIAVSSMKAGPTSFVQAFYSSDRSKLLVCNFYFHRKTKIVDRDFVVLSTKTSELLYSGTFSYNYTLENTDAIQVDNLGNAYFQNISYQRTGSKFSGKSKGIHSIRVFSPAGASANFTISFPGKYVPGIDIIQEDKDAVYIAGLSYDEDVRASRTSSADLFLYRLDPAGLYYTDSVFTTVNGLYPEGKLKAEDRLAYTIRHIYESQSGELVLVAEQYQQTISQYLKKEMYNDIACIRLNKDKDSGTAVRIPKLQFDFDNPSILSTFIDDKVFLLYNDLQENLSATGETVKYVANKNDKNGLFLVTIGKDNKYNKELLYGYDSGKPMPIILSSSIIHDRTILLCSDGQVGLLKFVNQ